MRNIGNRWWHDETGGVGVYFFGILLIWILLVLTVAMAEVHAVSVARATMSRYVQIALQQTNDLLGVTDAFTGQQGIPAAAANTTVSTLFSQQLRTELTQTRWATATWSVATIDWYTQAAAGQPAPQGVPGGKIPGAGIYVRVNLRWPIPIPGVSPFTIPIPEWMSANVWQQPTRAWIGG